MKLNPTLYVCVLATIAACGGSDYNGSSSDYNPPQNEQTQEGVFTAELVSENPNVSLATGSTQVSLTGDDFNSTIVITNAMLTTHAQHIHAGNRCPTPADDTNKDGVVDATEATAVYGAVVLPLDSDLTTNGGTFPSGINYRYNQSGSFAQIIGNLNLPSLNVEGMVVNVHGVPETTQLPPTIQGGKAAFPIACGVLVRTGLGPIRQ